MEAISPLLLYCAAIDLQKIIGIIDSSKADRDPSDLMTEDDCNSIRPLMDAIQSELIKLNCPVSAASAAKPDEMMQHGQLTYARLRSVVEEIDGRIRDEIKLTHAFSLSHAEAALFNPADPILGDKVQDRFESASFDIEEAAKCHALGRSTGAVFHTFRVLEVGVRAVAKALQVPDLEKPAMRNWGKVLEAIETAIKERWPRESDRDSGDGELFWEVYTLMLAIKTPRNGTMHPARKYTHQEADRILRIVADIMMRLGARINEEGEPKVRRPRKSRVRATGQG